MSDFAESWLGQLRAIIGNHIVLMPGTRIVIERADGRILLDHRADFRIWALIGGAAEVGESLEETIRREVTEETGMVLGAITPFGVGSDPKWRPRPSQTATSRRTSR